MLQRNRKSRKSRNILSKLGLVQTVRQGVGGPKLRRITQHLFKRASRVSDVGPTRFFYPAAFHTRLTTVVFELFISTTGRPCHQHIAWSFGQRDCRLSDLYCSLSDCMNEALGRVETSSSKAGLSRAGAVFYVNVIPISVARQVASSRAGAVFYVSVIPISVARQVAWSRAEQSIH